ncbi:MAG: head GIN domain-containing protein [Chlamydiota bacterium]|nr:head GIN domain-containing protein [Chlamydiota bacterium]
MKLVPKLFFLGSILLCCKCGFTEENNTNNFVTFDIRNIPSFSKVTLKGIGELIFSDINQEIIKIQAEKSVIPQIETTVTDGELLIQTKGVIRSAKPIKYYLAVEDVNAISVSGSAKVSNVNLLKVDSLDIKASGASRVNIHQLFGNEVTLKIQGSATVNVKGAIERQTIDVAGAGQYQGLELISNVATVNAKGAARVIVNTKDKLTVNASGASSIKYKGSPTIEKKLTGVASLSPVGQKIIEK